MRQPSNIQAEDSILARRRMLLQGMDVRAQRGIEFGPLDCPLVTKTDGPILYIDYAPADELRAKHGQRPGKDPAAIVEVDRIWNAALPQVLHHDLPLDYAVACHVIEHVPDLAGWLDEVACVLRPGGRLCLTVPDQRFTFDRLREPSDLAEVVGAHVQGLRRPSPRQVFEHHHKATRLPLRAAWQGRLDEAGLVRIHDFEYALAQARKAQAGKYVDCHCWVFTPLSFLALMAELARHGLLPFRLHAFYDTRRNTFEFQAVLECDQAIPHTPELRTHAAATFTACFEAAKAHGRPGRDIEAHEPSGPRPARPTKLARLARLFQKLGMRRMELTRFHG